MQRIVSRLNPKVGPVDLNHVLEGSIIRSLEAGGFLTEMRKNKVTLMEVHLLFYCNRQRRMGD